MSKPLIITYPNEILKKKTHKVVSFDNALKQQITEMVEALREDNGMGLAANQIGYDNQVIIAEFDDPDGKEPIPLSVFVNPEIVEFSGETDLMDEGCLSIPRVELETERAKKIKIKYQNEDGQIVKIAPKGILARILQHEVDHLNGIMFTDRVKNKYFKDYPELKKVKILFCGSGEYARIILRGLLAMGFDLTIITETAKPSGRGREITNTPAAEEASHWGKKYIQTDDISKLEIRNEKFDLLICSDFGQKIPDKILNSVKIPINVHPSLLPKYRGATPIQTAIFNGDKETGVSLIRMSPQIDQGLVLAQITTEIDAEDDSLTLKERLSVLGLKVLVKVLPKIWSGEIKGSTQDEARVTKTRKFTKEDGLVDWNRTPQEIDRQIRALYPWPGTYTFYDNKRLIIHLAHLENNQLVLDIIQPEGKKPMVFKDFLLGLKNKPEWITKVKV